MKGFISCLLIFLLAAPLEARDASVPEQAGKIKLGAKMEVTLQTGEVLQGRRGAATNTGVSLEPMKDGHGATRVLEYQQIRSLRRTGLTTGEKAAIIAIAAVGALALGLYAYVKATGC